MSERTNRGGTKEGEAGEEPSLVVEEMLGTLLVQIERGRRARAASMAWEAPVGKKTGRKMVGARGRQGKGEGREGNRGGGTRQSYWFWSPAAGH